MKLTEETGEKEEEPESAQRRRGKEAREREIPKIKYQDAVLRGNAVPCYYNRYNRHCPPGDRLLHGQLALHRGQARSDPGSYPISIPRGASDLILALRYHVTRKTRKSEVEEHDNNAICLFTEKNTWKKDDRRIRSLECIFALR